MADDLDDRVRQISAGSVRVVTRKLYGRSLVKFLLWVFENAPGDLCAGLRAALTSAGALPNLTESARKKSQRAAVLNWLEGAPENAPPIIHLPADALAACDVLLRFLASLKLTNGAQPGNSVFNTHRSAYRHMLRSYQQTISQQQEDRIETFFKGLHRANAAQRHLGVEGDPTGTRALRLRLHKPGKEPLPFSLLRVMALQLLKTDAMRSQKDASFLHLFMLVSWNLMCRAANSETVRYDHIGKRHEAVAILFNHMKNDQEGSRPVDPRHCYSNAVMPELDLFLSFGLYHLLFGFSATGFLFPGASQSHRAGDLLRALLTQNPEVERQLEEDGLHAVDIGTHSFRKGAAQFALAGTTACPSGVSVCLRAGWSLPGVQNTYIRYDAAGDQYVGRTVCGLPLLGKAGEFATMPARWRDDAADVDVLTQAINASFPVVLSAAATPADYDAFRKMTRALSLSMLAALVYHEPWLRATLSSTHIMWSTPLFAAGWVGALRPLLVGASIPSPTAVVQPTGIPPHTVILSELHEIGLCLSTLREGVCADVARLMEEKAVGYNTVTPGGLDEKLDELYRRVINGIRQAGQLPAVVQVSPPQQVQQQPQQQPMYEWADHTMHALPENYELPPISIAAIWPIWNTGVVGADGTLTIPPLSAVAPSDFQKGKPRQSFSTLRRLMKPLDARCVAAGIEEPADRAKLRVTVAELGGTPKRRLAQFTWQTADKHVRQKRVCYDLALDNADEDDDATNDE